MSETGKTYLIFRYDEEEQYLYKTIFINEKQFEWEYYSDQKYIFCFDVLKLPHELLTIWKGNLNQGWDYPLQFQFHVAQTYFDRYIKDEG